VTRTRFLKVSVLAATAALLTGCGLHPGAAAVVGDQTIPADKVDAVATAFCSTSTPGSPSRGARSTVLAGLIDAEIWKQFGASEGVSANPSLVDRQLAPVEQQLKRIPADERDAFRSALQEVVSGSVIQGELGRRYLVAHGTANPSPTQAAAAAGMLRTKFLGTLKVEVDPRFGTFSPKSGTLGTDGGSLSVPASAFALDGGSPQPSQSWAAILPASQKCG